MKLGNFVKVMSGKTEKEALRDTQKIVSEVKAKAFKGLYSSMYHSHILGTRGKEKHIYRLAKCIDR